MSPWRVMMVVGAISWAAIAGGMSANASTLTTDGSTCRPERDLRCWYLIGAIGEQPERVAFVARHVDPTVAGEKRRVELLQVVEKVDFPERFSVWRLQFDCQRKMFRVEASLVGLPNGTAKAEPVDSTRWYSLEEGRSGEGIALPFACEERGQGSDEVTKLFMGNLYRGPDLINLFRRVYWEEDASK